MVHRISSLDHDASVRHRRTRREEQSRYLLGDAGSRVRQTDRQSRRARLLSQSLQDDPVAEPTGRGWELPAGVAADETLQLFIIQSRGIGRDLPDSLDSG